MSENNRIAVCVQESGRISRELGLMGYDCVGFDPSSMSLIKTIIVDSPCAVVADRNKIDEGELIKAFDLLEGSRPVCILIGDSSTGRLSPLSGLDKTYCMSELPAPSKLKGIISGTDKTSGYAGYAGHASHASHAGGSGDEADCDRELEDSVTEIIRKLGIPANIKGYRYIRTAVIMCLSDPGLLESVTGRLYPEIALQYDSTPTRVERAVRHAITVAWDRAEGDEEYVSKRLHCRINFSSDRPTNSELIALISDSLMLERRHRRNQ